MQKKYGPKGFTVVSVSNDAEVAEAAGFSKKLKTTFPVVHDPQNVVYGKMGNPPAPSNMVIDRKGKVVYSHEGADLKGLEAAVAKAMAAK